MAFLTTIANFFKGTYAKFGTSANLLRELSLSVLTAVVVASLVQLLAWCWEKPMDKQPFPSITVGRSEWLLPEAGFVTMSFGELTDLYIHLQAFIQQTIAGDERLDYLVATACRPRRQRGYTTDPTWNGDNRELYNEFQTRKR